jgi:hypothetical protein
LDLLRSMLLLMLLLLLLLPLQLVPHCRQDL